MGKQDFPVVMAWRRHLCRGLVSSGSTIAMTFAPALVKSLGGRLGVDVDCDTRRWHQAGDGSCVGSWFVSGRYGFLFRRLRRVGVPDLEFDGVSRLMPYLDSFNNNSLTFGKATLEVQKAPCQQ